MTRKKKKKEEKPAVRGDLKSDEEIRQEMMSHPEMPFIIVTVVTGVLCVWILAPAACVKLRDAFPGTGINLFAFIAIIALWFIFIAKMRKLMLGDEKKEKPEWTGWKDWIILLITGFIKIGKDVWDLTEKQKMAEKEKKEEPKHRVTITRKRTVIIRRKKKD